MFKWIMGLWFILLVSYAPVARTPGAGLTSGYPVPEDGGVENGSYANAYFGFRYPLPAHWTEDLKGPEPSATGYYSLVALKPEGDMSATMQISAQDNFFAPETVNSAMDFAGQMKQHLDPSLSVSGAPAAVEVAGHTFARVEYSGAGLTHAVFATEIRCHTVIFSITSSSEKAIAGLVQTLNRISFSAEAGWPVCLRDYVTPEHVVRRVDPAITGPRYASVPVRLIIGADGKVAHVHTIAGFPEQAKSVTDALGQWEFKPYVDGGRAVEVETGLLFQFPQAHSSAGSGN